MFIRELSTEREVFDKKVMVAGCKNTGTHKYLMDSGLTKTDKECMKVRMMASRLI